MGIGRIDYERGRLTSAAQHLGEALGIYRELGDRYHVAYMLGTLGGVAFFQGESEAANEAFTESLRLREELGDRLGAMIMRLYLGRVAAELGDLDRAAEMLLSMLPELLNAPDLRYRSEWLRAAAELEMAAVRTSRTEDEQRRAALNAALLIGRAEEQPGAASEDLSPVERGRFDAITTAARSVLGARQFDAATMRGREFTFEQAMDLAVNRWNGISQISATKR